MKVIGFNFKKISGEKYKELTKGFKINSNIEIKDVKPIESKLFGNKEVFNFTYNLTTNYDPGFAKIEFEGSIVLYFEDEKLTNKIKESWRKKKVPEDLKISLLNIIFSKCNLKSLQIEEDLVLPYHLPIPKFTKEERNKVK